MSKRQLTAEMWRVISYLYHPDQLGSRVSPSLATIMNKQDVYFDDVAEVVERGLVQARVGGEECTLGQLVRLPEKAVRLRLTKSGIYHAGHDPQHLVVCALRSQRRLSVFTLEHGLAERVSFGELVEMVNRNLIVTYLRDSDAEVPLRTWGSATSLVTAVLTDRGRTFVSYP